MASQISNRGIVYWTDRENKILLDNLHKPMHTLRNLLPSRTDSAIYQRRLKFEHNPPRFIVKDTTIERMYPVVENQSADSITFQVHGVNITINFQK